MELQQSCFPNNSLTRIFMKMVNVCIIINYVEQRWTTQFNSVTNMCRMTSFVKFLIFKKIFIKLTLICIIFRFQMSLHYHSFRAKDPTDTVIWAILQNIPICIAYCHAWMAKRNKILNHLRYNSSAFCHNYRSTLSWALRWDKVCLVNW